MSDVPEGAHCGCECGCRTRLTEGNAMEEDITDELYKPWETPLADSPHVRLLICADCYVGQHHAPSPEDRGP